MNVEHRTLNVQRRIMYSINLIKDCVSLLRPRGYEGRERIYNSNFVRRRILRFACYKIDKAKRHQYSTFDVGRSMFDVQGFSPAWRSHCSGLAESHTEFYIRYQPLTAANGFSLTQLARQPGSGKPNLRWV